MITRQFAWQLRPCLSQWVYMMMLMLWMCSSTTVMADAFDKDVHAKDPYSNLQYIRWLSKQGHILPMQQLLKKASATIHGKIIESGLELGHSTSTLLYEIEYIDEAGRVHEVYFNAKDGSPVKTSKKVQGKP